jgi:hypothetical protein
MIDMETILNLIWLSTVIGAAEVYRVRAAALPLAPDSSRRKREVALVLLCVVALLFPIISVTDDLAIDVATLDVWTAARRVSTVLITLLVVALAGCSSLVAVTVDLGRAPVRLASVGLGELPILSILSPSTETVWSFRAPPAARS